MKKLFIVANWKSNKTRLEAREWLQQFVKRDFQVPQGKEVIVCPPYHLLPFIKDYLLEYIAEIKLGAQDVSSFPSGSYTGQINATQVKEFAEYAIVGHSERRKYFSETDEMLEEKVKMALSQDLTPIFCVQGKETKIPSGVTVVAYEPIAAIGTGNPDTPEDAEEVAVVIKQKNPQVKAVLYGGSVTADNVNSFTNVSVIDGVLVGGASLDAKKFVGIVGNA
ncbi:MAG: triose-phosphate isomerase [Patescibacteria group bacterium]